MPLARYSYDCWFDFHHSPDDKREDPERKREGKGAWLQTDPGLAANSQQTGLIPPIARA